LDLGAGQWQQRQRAARMQYVRCFDDSLQQMTRADRVAGRVGCGIQQRMTPRILQYGGSLQRERWLAAQIAWRAIDRLEERVPERVDIDVAMLEQGRDIAVAGLDQFQEPVLDGDFTRKTRLAKIRGGFECMGAMRVEPAQQRGRVSGIHNGHASIVSQGRNHTVKKSGADVAFMYR
jgi:hypothetical protein